MELQQDTIDLTINDDDDSLFPPELGEMVGSSELGETVGNKETAKQNLVKQELYTEDDTMSICGSEDGEITTIDEEEEKEEEEENGTKKVIFKKIWPKLGRKPRKATFKSAAFDVYSCNHKIIYPGHRGKFSLGFKMKMP